MQIQDQFELGHVVGRMQNGLIPALLVSLIVTLLWSVFGFGWFDFTLVTVGLLMVSALALGLTHLVIQMQRYTAAEAAWREVCGQVQALGFSLYGRFQAGGRAKKPKDTRQRMLFRFAGIVHALRGELRGVHALDDLADLLNDSEFNQVRGAVSGALDLVQLSRADLRDAVQQEWLSATDGHRLEDALDALVGSMKRCTLMAETHSPPVLSRGAPLLATLCCGLLPLGLVTTTGWLTPVVTVLVSIFYLLPSIVAEAFSKPYGAHPDCLPLYRDSRAVETNLKAMLGQDALPRSLEPFGGVIR